ncbi:MAG: PAS domain S-box protein [Firmicutes bacterium]|nr:PAS domain S-box protein [Bacillota bacterium]
MGKTKYPLPWENLPRHLEYVLKATKTGLDIIDADYNLLYVDSRWQSIYGPPKGRKCYQYFKDRQEPCENCGVPEAMKTKKVTLREQTLPKENNRIVEAHVIPFQNREGEWLAAEFKVDITRSKRLERELEETIDKLAIEKHILEDVLESTLAGYWDWDLVSNSQYLSPAFKKMFGYQEHELPNRPESWQGIIFPQDLPLVEKLMEEHIATRGKVPFSIEVRYRHKDGSTVWVICAGRVIQWAPDGRPLRMVGCHVDITELKKTEEALQKSRESLSVTLNSIGDGVITTDVRGRVTHLNPKAEALTGWTREEALGQPILTVFNIVNAKSGAPAFNPVEHVLATGETVGLANDTALISRDGCVRQIGDSAAPIRDREGNVTGVVMVFSDVTEQYEAQKRLAQSEERYRTIVENINDALFIRDFQGKILDLNEAACKMLGYKREELLGTNLSQLRSPQGKKLAPQHNKRLRQDDTLLFEGNIRHKKGHFLPIEASLKVVSREGEGLIQAFLRDISDRKEAERQLAARTTQLEKLYTKLDEEMNKAREVHLRTLPQELPTIKGLSFAAHYQPAARLGGDFYDVEQVGDKLIIYLSDVTGHGVDGAMLSMFVKHTIRGYLSFAPAGDIRPEKILRHLSTQFQRKNLPREYFICIFLSVLNLKNMELTYTAAGFQDAPLVQLGNGEKLKLVSKGLFLSPTFSAGLLNLKEDSIRLTPGTTILFNTDGLTEQRVEGGYYGTRLPGIFYENSHLPPQLLKSVIQEDFRNHNGGSLQGDDDITFLILQLNPGPKIKKKLVLPSHYQGLEYLQREVSHLVGNSKGANLFLACLHELTSNAMEHGNRLDKEKTVTIEITITENLFQASVQDQGEGFDWRQQIDKPLELEGISARGRGIAMVRICSNGLFYNELGNRATFLITHLRGENNRGD